MYGAFDHLPLFLAASRMVFYPKILVLTMCYSAAVLAARVAERALLRLAGEQSSAVPTPPCPRFFGAHGSGITAVRFANAAQQRPNETPHRRKGNGTATLLHPLLNLRRPFSFFVPRFSVPAFKEVR